MFTRSRRSATYAVKPMNCPGHVQIFNQGLRSYRDLPMRYGEFGACHRNEPSGALHGIMRVRGFTQDDGHIFCTEDQIEAEVDGLPPPALRRSTRDFGFTRHQLKIALRPDKRLGDDATGTRPRRRCAPRCAPAASQWQELPGEGAFYGPKIEYHLKDAHRPRLAVRHDAGRFHDAGAPRRRVRRRGQHAPARPVMLHRAIVGSHGALHRHPDRAPRRRVAALAGAGPGRGDEHHRRARPTMCARSRKPCESRLPGRLPICGTRRSL